jgi:hypothetical protein
MNQSKGPSWDRLEKEHPRELVKELRERFERGEPFELDAEQFTAATDFAAEAGRNLLEVITKEGFLLKRVHYVCPCEREEPVTAEQARLDICAVCGEAFKDRGNGEVVRSETYSRQGVATRDVRWVLALHGMNTRGAWQESFNWMVSRLYGYSVPIAIYKYGIVRQGAILRFRQRALTRQLINKIKTLRGESSDSGFGGVPDVIAHSFGTWLIGHALRDDEDIHVGRIILLGCILRPDFDWSELLKRGQVEAVLCHYGTRDFWARISHYVIPDSGPSGRRGFNDRDSVTHVTAKNLSHSGFFDERQMTDFQTKVWQPFLTRPLALIGTLNEGGISRLWRQAWWPFRATVLRLLILFLLAGVCALLLIALIVGCRELFQFL